MRSELFVVLFIILCFCVVVLLSILSKRQNESKKEIDQIISIDSEKVKELKKIYLDFSIGIVENNNLLIKKNSTKTFQKQIKNKKVSSEKILCIINTNVLNLENNIVEVEFISRNVNSEVCKNICAFLFTNNIFKIDNIY